MCKSCSYFIALKGILAHFKKENLLTYLGAVYRSYWSYSVLEVDNHLNLIANTGGRGWSCFPSWEGRDSDNTCFLLNSIHNQRTKTHTFLANSFQQKGIHFCSLCLNNKHTATYMAIPPSKQAYPQDSWGSFVLHYRHSYVKPEKDERNNK